MSGNEKKQKKHGLDALRGVGITGIVLYHAFPDVFPGGFLGVVLFFVLSGYLMFVSGSAAWENENFHIINYYKKRFTKIYPPLFAMVMAVCCYLTLFHRGRMAGIRGEICSIFLGCDNWWQIRQNASYFTKIAGSSPFTHLWFLSIEIQFYLLWPVLFFAYQKAREAFGGKKICFLFSVPVLLSALWMWYLYVPGTDPSRVYYGTDTMAFSLFTGMFLGAVRREYPDLVLPGIRNSRTTKLLELCLLVICVLFMTVDGRHDFVYRGGMLAIALFFATLVWIVDSLGDDIGNLLDSSLLSVLGKYSYWIYLWHYPVIILALL